MLSVVNDPIQSPSIIEELEVGAVPEEKKEFHISLFGELTKDNQEDLEGSGDSGPVVFVTSDNTGLFDPVTIPPSVVVVEPKEETPAQSPAAPVAPADNGLVQFFVILVRTCL